MTEALTLYKLIVLYTLDKARMPMTNAQICDLMLDKEYTTYFRVQEVLSEMEEAHLIHPEKIRNVTQYTITAEGENTIDFFSHQISAQIREEIDEYLKDHAIELRNTVSHPADYDRKASGSDTCGVCDQLFRREYRCYRYIRGEGRAFYQYFLLRGGGYQYPHTAELLCLCGGY